MLPQLNLLAGFSASEIEAVLTKAEAGRANLIAAIEQLDGRTSTTKANLERPAYRLGSPVRPAWLSSGLFIVADAAP